MKIFGTGGLVEPLSGWHFCQEYDRLNTERFQQFINAVGCQLGEDMAVIQLDRAGAHVTSALQWPDNLIPVCQRANVPNSTPLNEFGNLSNNN